MQQQLLSSNTVPAPTLNKSCCHFITKLNFILHMSRVECKTALSTNFIIIQYLHSSVQAARAQSSGYIQDSSMNEYYKT